MKTSTLSFIPNGHSKTHTLLFNAAFKTRVPQLVSLLLERVKRITLSATIILSILLGFSSGAWGQGLQTFNTSGTFTVPLGVTNVKVEVWGSGSGGNNSSNWGGGGGAFAGNNSVSVTPGSSYPVTVGIGGAAAGNGANSSFSTLVIAAGSVARIGGTTAASTGSAGLVWAGGNGGTSTSTGGAGGGGSAGAGGNGGNGANSSSGTGGTGGIAGTAGTGTAGAAGGAGGNTGNPGIIGSAPGGGGGENSSAGSGSGTGGNGRVIVTWTCPAATISYSGTSFCKSAAPQSVTITGTAGGTFSAVPSGLSINSSGVIDPSISTPGTYVVHYQIASGGNGCTAVNATASITINGSPVSSVTGQSNITCFAGSDGSITIQATGGTGPYNYSVDDGVTWTPALPVLPNPYQYGGLNVANNPYRVKVKDSNGCKSL